MYAVIDIGSNTVRLAVYRYENGKLYHIHGKKHMSKLIEHIKDGHLEFSAADNLTVLLNEYKTIAQSMNVSVIYAFATASLRSASNCNEVLLHIKNRTGLDIDIISGEEEARINYVAACSVFHSDTCLITDIGGGSTEVITTCGGKISEFDSLPCGSLKMYIKYVSDIIPTPSEADDIKTAITKLLTKNFKKTGYDTLIGIGGSIKNFAKLAESLGFSNSTDVVQVSVIRDICALMTENHEYAAMLINKVSPDRLTTLIPGIIIADAICTYFGCNKIKVCYTGVREGYILDKLTQPV